MKKILFILFVLCCSFTYPDNFCKMMKYILRFEGGFTTIDPGGTNFGIMQCNYDTYRINHKLKKQSVEYITMDEVYDCYYNTYYLRCGADTLPPALAFVHYDTAINCGIGQAHKFVSKVNALTYKQNALRYVELRDQLYKWLAANKDKKRFLDGWLNRDKQIRLILMTDF